MKNQWFFWIIVFPETEQKWVNIKVIVLTDLGAHLANNKTSSEKQKKRWDIERGDQWQLETTLEISKERYSYKV